MRNRSKVHPKTLFWDQTKIDGRLDRSAWAAGQVPASEPAAARTPPPAAPRLEFEADTESAPAPGSFEGLSETALAEVMRAVPYRDAVCTLCEKTVALALDIPVDSFQMRNRSSAGIALARQIAMYLAHTTFSLLLTEIGLHFQRDRTTVSHACAMVEDKRDELEFDVLLTQLESLLIEARHAMAFSLGEILQHAHASASTNSAFADEQSYVEPHRRRA